MTDLIQPFLKNTYSVQQIRSRLNVLRNYLQSHFFNSEKQHNLLTAKDQEWIQSLGTDFFKSFTALNVNQELDNLDKSLRQIQPLIIYIPIELPDDEINRLGDWVRKNFGSNLVIDIKYDGSLIGGAALSWKGIYHDLSLKAAIEKNKSHINESLKKYLR